MFHVINNPAVRVRRINALKIIKMTTGKNEMKHKISIPMMYNVKFYISFIKFSQSQINEIQVQMHMCM